MRNKKYRAVSLPIVLLLCSIICAVCFVLIAETTTEKVLLIVGCVFILAVAIFIRLDYVEITEDSIIHGIGGVFSKGWITQQILIADIEQISMADKNKVILINFKTSSPAANKSQHRWAFGTTINLHALNITKRDRKAIAVVVNEIAEQVNSNKATADAQTDLKI